jgi:large subunit ribosomal protein L3
MPEQIAQIVQSKLEAAAAVKAPPPTLPALEQRPMKKHSRRTGAIAIKAGMTQEWDQNGVRVPLTVLWIDDCQVCV